MFKESLYVASLIRKEGKLTKMIPRCHPLSFVVIRCHSLPFFVNRCHSLSLFVSLCTSHCHSLYHSLSVVITCCHSLSLVVPVVVTRCIPCLFFYKRLIFNISLWLSFHVKVKIFAGLDMIRSWKLPWGWSIVSYCTSLS